MTGRKLAVAIAMALTGCMQTHPIGEVLKSHTPELMALPGVVGTGEGERDGRPVILVLVARRSEELLAKVPSRIEGYPVEIRVVGEVRKLGGEEGAR
jgi:hypothetical protein